MMNKDQLENTAKILTNLWLDGKIILALPDKNCPRSKEDAYKIQSYFEQISHYPLFGWKAAATRTGGNKITNIDGPKLGRLIAERRIDNNSVCSLKANRMCVAEPEFAFKMAKNFKPRLEPYTIEEVADGVESLYPAIEIPSTRLSNFKEVDTSLIIADNALAHEYIIGNAYKYWRGVNLSKQRVIGETPYFRRIGTGANVMNDPLIALTWVVNELSQYSIVLKAGQFVLTGTCIDPIPVKSGEYFKADFGKIGSVSVKFCE